MYDSLTLTVSPQLTVREVCPEVASLFVPMSRKTVSVLAGAVVSQRKEAETL